MGKARSNCGRVGDGQIPNMTIHFWACCYWNLAITLLIKYAKIPILDASNPIWIQLGMLKLHWLIRNHMTSTDISMLKLLSFFRTMLLIVEICMLMLRYPQIASDIEFIPFLWLGVGSILNLGRIARMICDLPPKKCRQLLGCWSEESTVVYYP